ncbi:hypothetical protein BGZ65_000887, partial [Modicella reniformis]
IVPSLKNALSLQQVLELTNVYLENAYKTKDQDIALTLCHDAEVSVSQAKVATKKNRTHSKDAEDQPLQNGIAAANIDRPCQGYQDEAEMLCKKAEKWDHTVIEGMLRIRVDSLEIIFLTASYIRTGGAPDPTLGSLAVVSPANNLKQPRDIAIVPPNIFAVNVRSSTPEIRLPEADERLKRLKILATDVIRAFKRDEIKDAKVVAEVVYLAPVLEKDAFQDLLREFYSGIDQSGMLDVHQLEGLAQLVQGVGPGYFEADNLVKVLELLSNRLRGTHQQSPCYIHRLTVAVSNVLDAMADTEVKDLDRVSLHEPLSTYLNELKGSSDPYLVFQAAYAYQALICVLDNESLWKAGLRRTGKMIQGFTGLDIQQGFAGVTEAVKLVKTTYEDVSSLAQSGPSFMKCLKEGFSFECKCAWYSTLRGADALIRDRELVKFKKLVCEVPCRRDPAFQWGVCQRLSEIAANPKWDAHIRGNAISFLGEIYKNDAEEFTEPQISELKFHPKFILICDGYDESQQTHNLYASNRLNQPGEWDAQMVISCRSEYLGIDYRDHFQPGDRNQQSESSLFQEAVITPFTLHQVQDYIKQYVALNQPLWQIKDYNRALVLIPSLKELVKNPFLMTLSLEVLPRMVDPSQQLSAAPVTRVALMTSSSSNGWSEARNDSERRP